MSQYFAHQSAIVDNGATIGAKTRIWHFAHIFAKAVIGRNCSLGQNTMIANNVRIGDNVKIQNNVAVYEGTIVEDDVFLGPSCVLTNVSNPRSQVVRRNLYEKTLIQRGATVGANATIVCGITLGRYCFIGAGAVVAKSVPDYALIMGVPGIQKGWMSRHGHILKSPSSEGIMVCPESQYRYQVSTSGSLKCLDLGEEEELPATLSSGEKRYDQFKYDR